MSNRETIFRAQETYSSLVDSMTWLLNSVYKFSQQNFNNKHLRDQKALDTRSNVRSALLYVFMIRGKWIRSSPFTLTSEGKRTYMLILQKRPNQTLYFLGTPSSTYEHSAGRNPKPVLCQPSLHTLAPAGTRPRACLFLQKVPGFQHMGNAVLLKLGVYSYHLGMGQQGGGGT